MLKTKTNRANPKFKGIGNSNTTIVFIIKRTREAWETLGEVLFKS
jgi:hypothetical protein